MKVLMLRADTGGCFRYRMQLPALAVLRNNYDVEFEITNNIDVEALQEPTTGYLKVESVHTDADIVIVQRPVKQRINAMIRALKRQGIPVVVEADDDLTVVPPHNGAYSGLDPDNPKNSLSNWKWFVDSCGHADAMTVSTDNLTYLAGDRPAFVLPNYVSQDIFDIERSRERDYRTIGWTGSLQTHKFDLKTTEGTVARAIADNPDVQLYVVGDGNGVPEELRLRKGTIMRYSGWVDIDNYYQQIIDNIDIGIVPLARGGLNRGKSYLKGLEFAALGIPSVNSVNAPDYFKLYDYGVGELAYDARDYRYKLRKWLGDEERRVSDGQKYRAIVQENLTYEVNAHKWVNAWEQIIDSTKRNKLL